MRTIEAGAITDAVEKTFMEITHLLGDDLVAALEKAYREEESPLGKEILSHLLQNAKIGREEKMPVCQDTGTSVVFVEMGQEVQVVGGGLFEAINQGVGQAYTKGYLRASIVRDPILRGNTGDNTPPVVHVEVAPGNQFKITMMAKGSGCENMSRFSMLTPAQGRKGIIDFVVDTVRRGGGRPCPPLIVGVGLGGTFDQAAWIAKKSLFRRVGAHHSEPHIRELEEELLEKVNNLGMGPQAWGGRITALSVHVEKYPTHIASLPVAVNIECHSHRVRTVAL
jgi:fumarate hydratase subunit alpha